MTSVRLYKLQQGGESRLVVADTHNLILYPLNCRNSVVQPVDPELAKKGLVPLGVPDIDPFSVKTEILPTGRLIYFAKVRAPNPDDEHASRLLAGNAETYGEILVSVHELPQDRYQALVAAWEVQRRAHQIQLAEAKRVLANIEADVPNLERLLSREFQKLS